MNFRSLFKLQTAVVQIVIAVVLTIVFSSSNLSQAAGVPGANTPKAGITATTSAPQTTPYYPPPDPMRQAEAEEFKKCRDSGGSVAKCRADATGQTSPQEQTCKDAIKEYNTTSSKFKKNCSGSIVKCMERSDACSGDIIDRGTMAMTASAFDPTGCSSMLTSTKCPELNAEKSKDAKEEKTTLEEKKRRSQEKIEDLMEESQKLTEKGEESLMELKDKISESEKTLRDSQLKITDQIAAMKSSLGDEKTKAYRDARAAYTKIDEEYLKMRDQVRRDTSAVAAAKADLQRVCRTYAMQMYKEADQQLKQRIQEQQSQITNLGTMTTASGGTNREAKQNEKQRSMNYAGYFKDCLNGIAPEGTAALNKISELERTQKDNQAMLVDKAAMLEKQRAEVIQQIQELEASAMEKQSGAEQQAQQQLQILQQDYVKLQQSNQEKFMQTQNKLSRQQSLLAQKMQAENQELRQTDSELMLNQTKKMCADSNGGTMSQSAADRRRDKIDDAMESLEGLRGACGQLLMSCEGVLQTKEQRAKSASSSKPSQGDFFMTINEYQKSCDVYRDPETYEDYEGESGSKASARSRSKGSTSSTRDR